MHWSSHGFQSKIAAAALALTALTTWLILRGYHGLLGDAQLYAFQALARIQPQLASDLYLQNTSQDQFTIFSRVYAWFIDHLGLERAARWLTLLFTGWLLAAAWSAASVLTNRNGAWLAVIFLLIVEGSYGGASVFRFSEEFLTARLPAEALIVTSLACYFRGRNVFAIALAMAALFVHPLIALPGVMLLVCLSIPPRLIVAAAVSGVLAALVISGAATRFAWVSTLLPVMDLAWLNVVQERSQFLFLQLWSFRDWELNARPFFYLTFIAMALQSPQIRRLCMAAGIVGLSGLAVSLIAGALGPVAMLVQGQAWRWVWMATFVSALLLPATILQIWQDKSVGPLCAILLIAGLTLRGVNGTAWVSLGLILWLMRSDIPVHAGRVFRRMSWVSMLAIVGWILVRDRAILGSAILGSAIHTSQTADQVRDVFGLPFMVTLCAALVWWCVRSSRTAWAPTLLCAALLALSIYLLPAAFKQSRILASAADIAEFPDWESAIPPTSTVLVTPPRDVGTFVWFTLQRPNYLALDQSAGVVFSRMTALEVQRRSQVLQPLMDPNWKILTHLRAGIADPRRRDAPTRPLSAATLSQICTDQQLGFVIATQDVGFDPLPHKKAGPWMGWNLYDCRKVRLAPAK
jgi:hypothetical protein